MNDRQLFTRDLLVLFGLTGWAVAIPSFASEFVVSLALTCLMYIALATSWSLFCGTTRYLSLATAAFFGIGAYTSALVLEQMGWTQAILLGAAIATGVALAMGALVLHLRGTYFAVLTFGMTELIRHAITYWEKQVTGTVGRVLTVVPERDTIYLTMLLIAVLAVATSIVLRRTRFGLGLRGIGSDEQRAMTLGVDTRLIKIAGFALTAAFAGAAGAAMSVRWTYIDPTVAENLELGGWLIRAPETPLRGAGPPSGSRQLAKPPWHGARAERAKRIEAAFAQFPKLRERAQQLAGTMSGGEQQMVAVARALVSAPRLLMLDEPSLGLAPKMVDELLAAARRIADAGTTVLMVEQNVKKALAVADRGYVLERGVLVASGPAKLLARSAVVREAYLGADSGTPTAADAALRHAPRQRAAA